MSKTNYVLGFACLLSVGLRAASAQDVLAGGRLSIEVAGGTINMPIAADRLPEPGESLAPRLHLDLTGHPCLMVSGFGAQQIVNNSIYDHVLLLDNHCSKEIRIRACYYKSESCKVISIGGYQRRQQNLGVFPSPDFRYSYREYVN